MYVQVYEGLCGENEGISTGVGTVLACTDTCGGQRLTTGYFFNPSASYFLRESLSLNYVSWTG